MFCFGNILFYRYNGINLVTQTADFIYNKTGFLLFVFNSGLWLAVALNNNNWFFTLK